MSATDIVIKGAREHNLRDVDVVLPRNQLICLTGVSGSGKSSLAFDTLYAEGQRRYVESLSSFARQFLGQMPKPDVEQIAGLSPSISISQKSSGQNPRSTVGTITEIYDYLRVLYARIGHGYCPRCSSPLTGQSREQIIQQILTLPAETRFLVLAPVVRAQKGEYRDLFEDLLKQGYLRARVDGQIVALQDVPSLDRQMRHNIEVVIDRLVAGPEVRPRLAEAVDQALKLGAGDVLVVPESSLNIDPLESPGSAPVQLLADDDDIEEEEAPRKRKGRAATKPVTPAGQMHLSSNYACVPCGVSFEPPSPQLFSFNSPRGMCQECQGLGEVYSFDPALLLTTPTATFKQGCFELLGTWQDMGRWRRHIFRGVTETLERIHELEAESLLETPWNEIPAELQHKLLYGTGDLHITYTWSQSGQKQKYGGTFEGIIPKLLAKYRETNSKPKKAQLEKFMTVQPCVSCGGERLNLQGRNVKLKSLDPKFVDSPLKSLPQVCDLAINEASDFFSAIELTHTESQIATEVLKEVRGRLGFLLNVGLDYLTLARTAPTLSGGESQRIRLAGQVGCGLVGVTYILDEPSIGLHPRDNDRLLATLTQLRDQGNTVVVVEHDEDTMRAADCIIDFGPGPGVRGGRVVATGSADDVSLVEESLTGQYLSGRTKIEIPAERRRPTDRKLTIVGATHNNLKNLTVEFPLGLLICVSGVSGSGKSSLVVDILSEALNRDLNGGVGHPGKHERIDGLELVDKLIAIDQSPIGRTPRSNPATYIKVFDEIRDLYTQLSEAKARGYQAGRFSFNKPGGRCEACEGNGSNRLEMDFLADIWVNCPVCEGKRFNRETLQIKFKGKSIADVLDMDINEALAHFSEIPNIALKLKTLKDVGLDYLKLGQPSPTLSGGEAQRVKLARELVKRSTGKTIYLLDEPTTGLHFADIHKLLDVLQNFVAAGNTVLVIEHNLDVIKTADWVIEIGPEGGGLGGQLVGAGTPEEIAAIPESPTGRALAKVLAAAKLPNNGKKKSKSIAKRKPVTAAKSIIVQGASQHNLKHIDVEIPRDQITVCCGLSGSGKSSLAMDTVYAEGQRRYIESLSAYARQFVGQMQKPKLDHISGLSPAIAIEQKNLGTTPRSTVGTVTEIHDYLRVLLARLGTPYCPECEIPIGTQTSDQIVDQVLSFPPSQKLYLLAPLTVQAGEKYSVLWDELRAAGYLRVRIDGKTHTLDAAPEIDRRRKHSVEVVIDRITAKPEQRARIADSVEGALSLGRGVLHVVEVSDTIPEPKWTVHNFSQHLACHKCSKSFEPLTPHHFSFNSSLGWCESCEGLGTQTGANPAALLRDSKLSLADGAVALWPNLAAPLSKAMLEGLSRQTGIPLNTPYDSLSARQKRLMLHGTGEEWIDVLAPGKAGANGTPLFRFQFKGLYPAIEEACRLVPSFRGQFDQLIDEVECSACGGSRLRPDASAVRLLGKTLDDMCRMPLGEALTHFTELDLNATQRKVAGELIREISNRLRFLVDVGLNYLTLHRSAPTLSGGEAQRIRLASQIGSGLTGVLYVLDEPTIGLHPRDNHRLVKALQNLRDLGNTLLLVEHDREVIAGADQLLDFGPAAGEFGGQIMARGTPAQVMKQKDSVTGPYLSGKKAIIVPNNRRMESRLVTGQLDAASAAAFAAQNTRKGVKKAAVKKAKVAKSKADTNATAALLADARWGEPPAAGSGWLEVRGARHHNLRSITARIPLGTLTAVTGVSGSGKSSLVEDILYHAISRQLHRTRAIPGAHDAIVGIEQINKVIRVDQQPLGNSPTSTPATYTGVFELIRDLYAQLPESKVRGYSARRFSFNAPGGRCESCEGSGQKLIEMHFLPDVWVECDSCQGKRYNPETLSVQYRGKSIAEVLEMSCRQALELFENLPAIRRTLQTLCDVGLEYVKLGQSAPTLSGGEAQRVKLAAELSRPDTGRTLYLLDEPTTGLHFEDLAKLLDVLHRLVDLGNTVVVIEHNLDVIKTADWLLEIGPEAGEHGGYLVTCGTPEDIAAYGAAALASVGTAEPLARSHTGEALAEPLALGPYGERVRFNPNEVTAKRDGDLDIREVGRETAMPWENDGRRWHTVDRVGRNGEPCRWSGEILGRIVDRVHELGTFSPTDWNDRTTVEIAAERKTLGYFFHAHTGHEWLLTLKFRVAKHAFKRDVLVKQLDLKPLDEIPELPVYGREARVEIKIVRGSWHEVALKIHSQEEIDKPAFWKFVESAAASFLSTTERRAQNPEEVMPWKVLGERWHQSQKGFPAGKSAAWPLTLLNKARDLLVKAVPEGRFDWQNQLLAHYVPLGHTQPWATLHTKKLEALELLLTGPKGKIAFGRVLHLGFEPELIADRPDRDVIKLKFRTLAELADPTVEDFIREHFALANVKAKAAT